MCVFCGLLMAQPDANPCVAATWTASLLKGTDGAESKLRMEGRVFRADGHTPAAGVTMYVYQTGSDGHYGSDGKGGPRLRAWLKTDPGGRYRYDTIMPAPYPGRTTAAHIHIQFWGSSTPAQYTEDLYFDHDPLVGKELRERSQMAGRFANVIRLFREGGRLKGVQNFRLKVQADRFEESIQHGLERCQ